MNINEYREPYSGEQILMSIRAILVDIHGNS